MHSDIDFIVTNFGFGFADEYGFVDDYDDFDSVDELDELDEADELDSYTDGAAGYVEETYEADVFAENERYNSNLEILKLAHTVMSESFENVTPGRVLLVAEGFKEFCNRM